MIQRWIQRCIWVAIALLFVWILTTPVIEGADGDTVDEKITPVQTFILCSVISRMISENTIDGNSFHNSVIRNIGITDPAFTRIIDVDNTTVRVIIGLLNTIKGTFPSLPGGFTYPSINIPVPPVVPRPRNRIGSFFRRLRF